MYYKIYRHENVLERKPSSFKSSSPHWCTYLELSLTGEDADPLVVIVSNYNVTAWVNSHTCGTLQLPRWPSTHSKTTLEFTLVGKNLEWGGRDITHNPSPNPQTASWRCEDETNRPLPVHTDCCCQQLESCRWRKQPLLEGWWTLLYSSPSFLKRARKTK